MTRLRLPSFRLGLIGRAASTDTATNALWLIFSSIVNMALSLFVVAIAARYFGPETFGRFSYALSLVVLFTALSTLGLETLTVAALVSGNHGQDNVVGTSLILRLVGGALLTAVAIATVSLLEPHDTGLRLLVALLSLMMIFKSIDVIDYWFQSRLLAKSASIVKMIAYAAAAALKVLVIYYGGSIYDYAALYALDALLVGLGFIFVYRRKNLHGSRWAFDRLYAKEVLGKSWYIMLSGLMVTLYMRVDQVMLGYMYADKAVLGVYAAAIALSSMWYFIPMAVIASSNPRIMRAKSVGAADYEARVQDLFTITAWVTMGFSVAIAVSADVIVNLVYGSEFSEAAGLLRVSVFAGVFALLGSARGSWLVCEGLQRYSVWYIGGGALINIALNVYLIPLMGGYGAALATLIAQAAAVLLIPSLFGETRVSTKMIVRAFSVSRVLELGRRVLGDSDGAPSR